MSANIKEPPNTGKIAPEITRLCHEYYLQNRKVLVLLSDPRLCRQLDDYMWKDSPVSFLPHAVAGGANDELILITSECTNWHTASVLITNSPQLDETFALQFEQVYWFH